MSRKKWTQEEIEFLKKWYEEKGIQFISESLNRSYDAVTKLAYRLNLKFRKKNKEVYFV